MTAPTRNFFALASAMLCVNCDTVFAISGAERCPACGSKVITAIANFLTRRPSRS